MKTCVNGLILHWAGFVGSPDGENAPVAGNLKESCRVEFEEPEQ